MATKVLAIVGIVLGLGVAVGLFFRQRYMTDGPATYFDDPVEHFKYGSYGSEREGLPYPVWRALPEVCKEMLPAGWSQLGLTTEPGHDLPVGISVRKYGV